MNSAPITLRAAMRQAGIALLVEHDPPRGGQMRGDSRTRYDAIVQSHESGVLSLESRHGFWKGVTQPKNLGCYSPASEGTL
jgi:hypothetical protein